MSDLTVARQYANALYSVAARHGSVAAVRTDLAAFAAAVASHPELRTVFETPLVTPRKKRALVDALLSQAGEVASEVARLLTLLADRDRLMLTKEIARAFEERVMDAERAIAADVTTAAESVRSPHGRS